MINVNEKKGLITLVVVLSILVVGLSSYLIYDMVLDKEKMTNDDIENTDKTTENIDIEISLSDLVNVTKYGKYENGEYKSIYDNKYFRAKINNKWYLYSFETKDKVTDGYDLLYLIDDDTLLVKIDNSLYLKDLKGNNLTNQVIEIENDLVSFPPKAPEGIRVLKKNDIITISIVDGKINSHEIKYKTYEFNVKTNELKKLDIDYLPA